jgi:hypothetical protein
MFRPESLPCSKEKIVGDPSNQGCILHNISGRLIHTTEFINWIVILEALPYFFSGLPCVWSIPLYCKKCTIFLVIILGGSMAMACEVRWEFVSYVYGWAHQTWLDTRGSVGDCHLVTAPIACIVGYFNRGVYTLSLVGVPCCIWYGCQWHDYFSCTWQCPIKYTMHL